MIFGQLSRWALKFGHIFSCHHFFFTMIWDILVKILYCFGAKAIGNLYHYFIFMSPPLKQTKSVNNRKTVETVMTLMDTFDSFWEMDSDKKLNRKLNRPRCWRWRRSDDNSSTFFLRKVELKRVHFQNPIRICWQEKTTPSSILFELFPLFDLEFLQKIQFLNNYDRQWNETRHTCSLSNGEPITTRQMTHFLRVYWVSC
jgi:hypothetical protein